MSSLGNKTFTRIYNTDRIYIPYQTPAPNPSHKFFLNTTQENIANAFLIKKGEMSFSLKNIKFFEKTPTPTNTLFVKLVGNIKDLINSIFSNPKVGDNYEVIIVNETSQDINIFIDTHSVTISPDSVGQLVIVITNITPGAEDITLDLNKYGSGESSTVLENELTFGDGIKGFLTTNPATTKTEYDNSDPITIETDFGTTAGTVCEGNDGRLSDTRNTTNSLTDGTGINTFSFDGSTAETVSVLLANTNIFTDENTFSNDVTVQGNFLPQYLIGSDNIPISSTRFRRVITRNDFMYDDDSAYQRAVVVDITSGSSSEAYGGAKPGSTGPEGYFLLKIPYRCRLEQIYITTVDVATGNLVNLTINSNIIYPADPTVGFTILVNGVSTNSVITFTTQTAARTQSATNQFPCLNIGITNNTAVSVKGGWVEFSYQP
jgi:hypothetical protein